MLNKLILFVTAHGWNQRVYYTSIAIGFLIIITYCVHNAKHYGISKKTAFFSIIAIIAFGLFWILVLYWVEHGFKNFGGMNMIRLFVWYPGVVYVVTRITKQNWETWCDYHAPILCIMQGCANFGCTFAGCCYGYAWTHTLYNPAFHTELFPFQPIKATITILIGVYIWYRERKQNFAVTGENFPLMMLIFGTARFFIEFGCDNEKIILGLSSPALHSLLTAVVGAAWLVTVRERNEKKAAKNNGMVRKGVRA